MIDKKFKFKSILAFLVIFLAILPSSSNAKETSIEEISPSMMQKVKTAIHECFKTDSQGQQL